MLETKTKNIISDSELEKRFSKIKPRMTDAEALPEASRCLFCHDAPCINACPASIDIPMFIRQISTKNTPGSAKTIFTQNILGKSCAYVCPTEALCEGACVYNKLNEKPIDIGRLQGYATDHAIENNIRFFKKGQTTGKKVAVIGAGPGGLACAHELTILGHEVTVFEAKPKAGGLNAYGVAPYKYSNKEVEEEVKYISDIGFEIKTNCPVTSKKEKNNKGITFEELEKKYDAIFIGFGLGKSKQLRIKGENLKGVWGAAEFIHELREKELKIEVGKNVIVIGAGNTAIDAAVESSKLGADVSIVYRRSPNEQSAYYFEIELAKKNDVKFIYLASPIEIIGSSYVEGVKFIRNKLVELNGAKKTAIEPIPNSEFVIPCEMAIIATGQEKMVELLQEIPNLKLNEGKIEVNKNYQTINPKYFAGGDCINGGKEVVHAASDGRDAAREIDRYLKTKLEKKWQP